MDGSWIDYKQLWVSVILISHDCILHLVPYFWGDGKIVPFFAENVMVPSFGELSQPNSSAYENRKCSFTHTHLTAIFPGLRGWAGAKKVKPVWILLKQQTVSGSGIRWAICKSAPRSRQTTMPAPHHSVFHRPDRMPFLPPNQQRQSTEGFYTHTYPFNGPFSGTTRVSRYQKGNTNLDFCEARDSEWQWHQLGRMQVCT